MRLPRLDETSGPVGPGRAAVTVEAAIVLPVLFVILMGILVGGMGVFRYQQVASLAREASRHVAVKGTDWQRESKQNSPTQEQVLKDIVQARAIGMDVSKLSLTIQWVDGATGDVVDWDRSTKEPVSMTSTGEAVANRVRVTVRYQWMPEVLLVGPYVMQSVSESPMSF
jgi:Flp pilus assembly protein TadG